MVAANIKIGVLPKGKNVGEADIGSRTLIAF